MATRILVLQTLPRPQVFSPNNALLTLARHLDRNRYEMTVAVPREGLLPEALRESGVSVFRVPGLRTYRRHDALWRLPVVAWRTARLARRVGAGLLVANHAELGPFAHVAARLAGLPWIAFLRQADRSHRYYAKYRLCRADGVGGVSEAALAGYREFLLAAGLAPNPARAIPTGIPPPGPDNAADRIRVRTLCGWNPDERVVGTVGLRDVKRPDLLIRILGRLSIQLPEARCLLVGGLEDSVRWKLEELARSLGVAERIRFAGQQREMGPYYRALDAYAHTSRSEGFPKVILEAMAHGLPVVAFRVGGNPEAVVEGTTGFLCDPEDLETFGGRLLCLLSDRDLALRMGEAGRRRIEERFAPKVMAQEMMDFFDRVLGKRPPCGTQSGVSARGRGESVSPVSGFAGRR